jgi:hypothetical protein
VITQKEEQRLRSGGLPDLKRSALSKHQDVWSKVERTKRPTGPSKKNKDDDIARQMQHKQQKPPQQLEQPEQQQKKKESFSFKANNMQFFKPEGMKEATGYGEPRYWYFVIVKELFDNAIDWERDNYRGSADAKVSAVFTISEDGTKLNCKVRNSNPANKPVYAFQQLDKILDYSMTFGSKQNEYRITMGKLGDGLKRLMGLPFILMNMGDDTSAFFKKQWSIPMYFRANGIEQKALVNANLGASEAINQITQSPEKLSHTDTEVEITLPIIDEVRDSVTLSPLEKHCRLGTLAVTDVTFDIEIREERAESIIPIRTTIFLEAKHPIPKNWHNSTSIQAYRGNEFVNRLESLYDRQNTTVYEFICKFEEGA